MAQHERAPESRMGQTLWNHSGNWSKSAMIQPITNPLNWPLERRQTRQGASERSRRIKTPLRASGSAGKGILGCGSSSCLNQQARSELVENGVGESQKPSPNHLTP